MLPKVGGRSVRYGATCGQKGATQERTVRENASKSSTCLHHYSRKRPCGAPLETDVGMGVEGDVFKARAVVSHNYLGHCQTMRECHKNNMNPVCRAQCSPWVAVRSFSRVLRARSQMFTVSIFASTAVSCCALCVGRRRRVLLLLALPLFRCRPLPSRAVRGESLLGRERERKGKDRYTFSFFSLCYDQSVFDLDDFKANCNT